MLRWFALVGFIAGCRIGFDPREAGPGDGLAIDLAPGACTGYQVFAGLPNLYRVLAPSMDWLDVESACEADSAHLATIEDTTENAIVLASAGDKVWIAVSDRITEGTFLQVTGSIPAYSNWLLGPPSNTGEDCVQILPNGTWEDVTCMAPTPAAAICECDGIPVVAGSY